MKPPRRKFLHLTPGAVAFPALSRNASAHRWLHVHQGALSIFRTRRAPITTSSKPICSCTRASAATAVWEVRRRLTS